MTQKFQLSDSDIPEKKADENYSHRKWVRHENATEQIQEDLSTLNTPEIS